MKYKIYFLSILIVFNIYSAFAQQETEWQSTQKVTGEEAVRMGQDLINLLEADRYFEAKNLYDTICVKVDTIAPLIESLYRMYIARFEHRPDSEAFYLEEIIKNNLISNTMETYLYLWEIYAEVLQDYQKAYQTLDKTRAYLKQNPDSIAQEEIEKIQDHLTYLEKQTTRRAAEPTIRVVRKNTENSTPLLPDTVLKAGYLLFNASYNGHKPIRTLFDTGVSEYFFMDKVVAKQMGVRKYIVNEKDSTERVNGIRVSGYWGILDSIQIANIMLYHIPVAVFDMQSMIHRLDTVKSDSIAQAKIASGFYEHAKIIMGLKAMHLIGQIILDQENNQLSFPMKTEESKKKKEKNIFWSYNQLFTQLKINNLPITTFIDSGMDDYIRIDTRFYEKHKAKISIGFSVKNTSHYKIMLGRTRNSPFKIIVKDPVVTFTDKSIHSKKDNDIWISSFSQWGDFHADMVESTVGFPFLKRLGKKILFDFRNMRIEVVED